MGDAMPPQSPPPARGKLRPSTGRMDPPRRLAAAQAAASRPNTAPAGGSRKLPRSEAVKSPEKPGESKLHMRKPWRIAQREGAMEKLGEKEDLQNSTR
eukprot:166759-Pyramimonas_sp.AAC.1